MSSQTDADLPLSSVEIRNTIPHSPQANAATPILTPIRPIRKRDSDSDDGDDNGTNSRHRKKRKTVHIQESTVNIVDMEKDKKTNTANIAKLRLFIKYLAPLSNEINSISRDTVFMNHVMSKLLNYDLKDVHFTEADEKTMFSIMLLKTIATAAIKVAIVNPIDVNDVDLSLRVIIKILDQALSDKIQIALGCTVDSLINLIPEDKLLGKTLDNTNGKVETKDSVLQNILQKRGIVLIKIIDYLIREVIDILVKDTKWKEAKDNKKLKQCENIVIKKVESVLDKFNIKEYIADLVTSRGKDTVKELEKVMVARTLSDEGKKKLQKATNCLMDYGPILIVFTML